MNNKGRAIRIWVAAALVVAAAVVYAMSLLSVSAANADVAAAAIGRKVCGRLALLQGYMDKAKDCSEGTWTQLASLPPDMVVYRYVDDTLQSWANQFPIRSDDIRSSTMIQRLGASRSDAVSPLREIGPEWTFVSNGPKWFLEKCQDYGNCKIIAGLEVVDELRAGSMNGINSKLSADDRFTVISLSSGSGVAVEVDGKPLFALASERVQDDGGVRDMALQATAIALVIAAILILLTVFPNYLAPAILLQLALLAWLYFAGRSAGSSSQIFSPLLYADGPVLYSLGAVIIIIAAVVLLVTDVYIARKPILRAVRRRNSPRLEALISVVGTVWAVSVMVFCMLAFRSILANSDICLELYKVPRLSVYTAVVYVAFIALFLSVMPLLQLLAPFIRRTTGIRYNVFSVMGKAVTSVIIGVLFVAMSSSLGLKKEAQRVEVWANRLAMDRDVSLEMQLRMAEGAIASDQMLGMLSTVSGGADIIRGRIVGNYMGRISQDYDITVIPTGDKVSSHPLFRERVSSGVRLSDNSHFFYYSLGSGRVTYTGVFTWYVQSHGPASILVSVESKHNREDRGYLRLLGIQDPGRVSLPPVYSWAKYADDRLVQYKGAYSYPTVNSSPLKGGAGRPVVQDGWFHLVHEVSEGETIVISRPVTSALDYVVAGILLAVLAFLAMMAMSARVNMGKTPRYYSTRINLLLYISLIVTLVAMAGFSVWFVSKRNDADKQSVMISRVNTLQGMMQERLRLVESADDPMVRTEIESVGNSLRCDITFFGPDGRVIASTTPEVYDRMILGHRLDDMAYYNIMYANKRYYLQREKALRRHFYAMYAPVFNSNGKMIAILSSPFTDLTQDFETEAATHIASVLAIFLLLLIIARLVSYEMVSRLFRPLTEMSRKMIVSDVAHLEPISYDGDDELTPLVNAYNRMVHDLGESSRRLAQAERDKAWTDMARRVAHDLKNPLTPIKLQLQMLIRMKASGNPAWQERFDEVASTVLYHVDLLADSADQFSTFARMYDQKPERIDLDALIRQEVELFDSRDDVSIDYFGFAGVIVSAPRPQLTRVVVNLLTNAIQAVEGMDGPRRILVALRASAQDGFYDIVVEDNGPGVSEQNQEKIFTPDFTTKTSGSGLGLAICRRIAEHCGGSIAYSRSFTLGGACFTVRIPALAIPATPEIFAEELLNR